MTVETVSNVSNATVFWGVGGWRVQNKRHKAKTCLFTYFQRKLNKQITVRNYGKSEKQSSPRKAKYVLETIVRRLIQEDIQDLLIRGKLSVAHTRTVQDRATHVSKKEEAYTN